jgi:hypothetical protein
MSLLLSLLLAVRSAAAATAADTEQATGEARMYATVRGSVAVPTGYKGLAQSYSLEAGALFKDGNQVGLRFAYLPSPPKVYGESTPNTAFGPVFTWAYCVRIAPKMDLTPTVGAGAVFGADPTSGENKVLPYLQVGLGLRGRITNARGGAMAIGPEIGFVPTILAPYVALNLSYIGPKPAHTAPVEG